MTHQTLQQLADIIQDSKEPIETNLQIDRLTITTDKNYFWIFLSIMGIIISIVFIIAYRRAQHNLEIGITLLWISVYSFWRMQGINKTLVIDLKQKTLFITPNFSFQRWFLFKVLRVDTTYTFNNFPDLRMIFYTRLKYDWKRRIYFKKGIWTIYLLEFDKKETAQKILDLLTH